MRDLSNERGAEVKNCKYCKYALWDRRDGGSLHPSGNGFCEFPWKMPKLPGSMYWSREIAPKPYGGHISRHKELENDCPYFERMKMVAK